MKTTLTTYIGEFPAVLTAISQKDLTQMIQDNYIGNFIEIKTALDQILINLNDTMGQISAVTDQVASGTSQVTLGSQPLAQSSATQAYTVDTFVTSMERVFSLNKTETRNATRAGEFITHVIGQLDQGNEQMKQMLAAMSDINHSFNEISKIIKTIEDIAFHSNILALNAAVEVVHAVTAGKEFAVVADEVRNFANKNAVAAQNTIRLIAQTMQSNSATTEESPLQPKSFSVKRICSSSYFPATG